MPLRLVPPTTAALAAALALTLAACAAAPDQTRSTAVAGTARVWVHGEQHDQPDHQRQTEEAVRSLAAQGRLAALVIEMADAGRDTRGLPRGADAARVREALAWNGWDWAVYEGVVMAAVQAGVPVLGGNLPRAANREAMGDPTLDARIDDGARAKLRQAVDDGHCGMLPASQLPGMVRIQVARDASMARVVAEAVRAAGPGQQVLLLTGGQHAARDRGVPLHLQRQEGLRADEVQVRIYAAAGSSSAHALPADELRPAATVPRPDACVELRERMSRPAPPAAGKG